MENKSPLIKEGANGASTATDKLSSFAAFFYQWIVEYNAEIILQQFVFLLCFDYFRAG